MLLFKIFLLVPLGLYGALIGTALARATGRLLSIGDGNVEYFSTCGAGTGTFAALICALVYFARPPTGESIGGIILITLGFTVGASFMLPAGMVGYIMFRKLLAQTSKAIDYIFARK
jgi:hypothetical protein